MRIISISNQKGGVGKTTTAQNLGAGFTLTNARTLLVDLDPQGNLTAASGIHEPDKTITDVLLDSAEVKDVIVHCPSYDLVPADFRLGGVSRNPDEPGQEFKLLEKLKSVQDLYDIVVIDCPPDLHILTIMALTASDRVLIPLQAKYFSKAGLEQLLKTIEVAKTRLNHHLEVMGILFTMYDARLKTSLKTMEELEALYPNLVLKTRIRTASVIDRAQQANKDIFEYDSSTKAAKDYADLVKELFSSGKV